MLFPSKFETNEAIKTIFSSNIILLFSYFRPDKDKINIIFCSTFAKFDEYSLIEKIQ